MLCRLRSLKIIGHLNDDLTTPTKPISNQSAFQLQLHSNEPCQFLAITALSNMTQPCCATTGLNSLFPDAWSCEKIAGSGDPASKECLQLLANHWRPRALTRRFPQIPDSFTACLSRVSPALGRGELTFLNFFVDRLFSGSCFYDLLLKHQQTYGKPVDLR